MKAKINGFEIEGTFEEIKLLLFPISKQTQTSTPRKKHKSRHSRNKTGRRCKRWSRKEMKTLKALCVNKCNLRDISSELGRSAKAIKSRIGYLNIN